MRRPGCKRSTMAAKPGCGDPRGLLGEWRLRKGAEAQGLRRLSGNGGGNRRQRRQVSQETSKPAAAAGRMLTWAAWSTAAPVGPIVVLVRSAWRSVMGAGSTHQPASSSTIGSSQCHARGPSSPAASAPDAMRGMWCADQRLKSWVGAWTASSQLQNAGCGRGEAL